MAAAGRPFGFSAAVPLGLRSGSKAPMTTHAGPADPLAAACLVQGIELGAPIGRGRFATVFAGRWRERDVAVKVVVGRADGRPARALDHPAILDVLEVGEALGQRYLVLERFPADLRRLLGGKPLRRDLLRPVLLPLLDGLEHAHARGVAHGDLKPANVLVDPAARPPRVVLADFGGGGVIESDMDLSLASASASDAGGAATLAYLAPERLGARPGPATAAADVWALGLIIFELLTGRLPAGPERATEAARGLDVRWDGILRAAFARDPSARPTLARLRTDVLRLLPRPGGPERPAAGPADMVLIGGGDVVLGDVDDPDARPMREVTLAPFWLDRTPVSHEAWGAYMAATGAPRPKSWPRTGPCPVRLRALPITGVSYAEASAYASWMKKRLPTEEEWERAAMGPEHRRFPWGDAFDPKLAPATLVPVGQTPGGASSEGAHDLCGNGWEWTSSWFTKDKARTIKGGYDPRRPRSGSAHARAGLRPDLADPVVGFRCAKDA